MRATQHYVRRGTPDLPMAVYTGIAGQNMDIYPETDYHPETEITLQVEGTTTMEVDGKTHIYQKGDIFIIPPHTPHRRAALSDNARLHRIVFSTDVIKMAPTSFFQKEFVQPLSEDRLEMPLLIRDDHPAHGQLQQLLLHLEPCRMYEPNYKQHRLSLIMQICLILMPYCRIKENVPVFTDPGHAGVKLCMRYIHNHYAEKVTLSAVSKFCHLNPNYLSGLFKQYTGQTITDYLTRIRIETAAGFLLREDLPAGKIAELTGFRSECLFYKNFKAIMGMTPTAYRAAHRHD